MPRTISAAGRSFGTPMLLLGSSGGSPPPRQVLRSFRHASIVLPTWSINERISMRTSAISAKLPRMIRVALSVFMAVCPSMYPQLLSPRSSGLPPPEMLPSWKNEQLASVALPHSGVSGIYPDLASFVHPFGVHAPDCRAVCAGHP